MATLFTDAFTRADSTSIGGDYTEVAGDWAIASNELTITSTSGGTTDTEGYIYVTMDTALGANPDADYDVSATINPGASSSTGIAGRLTDGSNQMVARFSTVNQTVVLRKYVAGAVTTLGSYTGGYTAGTDYVLKMTMAGTTFNVYVDTVLRIGPVTDSSISATGKPAMKAQATSAQFDNFLVEGTADAAGSAVKTYNGLAYASVKTVNGLAIASVKTKNGLA